MYSFTRTVKIIDYEKKLIVYKMSQEYMDMVLPQQVGILSPLVSKLRAVAKNSSKIVKMSKNKFLGFLFWKKTVDLQEFKFFSTKVMVKWDG